METGVVVMGEQSSVEALYRSDADRLWRAMYAFSGDTEVASDAVAEAFAQLIRRGASVRDPAAWTWRAAFRICAGALKSRRTSATMAADTSAYSDRYANQDLIAALRRLPEGQRAAVILFYYADLPIGDIAHRLGSNGIAVRANLSRGRRRLRQVLGDDDG